MTDNETISRLLRSAMPPTPDARPARDLWPAVADHSWVDALGLWIDLGVAAATAAALVLFPGFLWLLAYHL
jgi:hypothetical protein